MYMKKRGGGGGIAWASLFRTAIWGLGMGGWIVGPPYSGCNPGSWGRGWGLGWEGRGPDVRLAVCLSH